MRLRDRFGYASNRDHRSEERGCNPRLPIMQIQKNNILQGRISRCEREWVIDLAEQMGLCTWDGHSMRDEGSLCRYQRFRVSALPQLQLCILA